MRLPYLQVLFDHNGVIKRYNSVEEILREFFTLRLEMYKKRKDYLEGMMAAESLKYDNIARFIMKKIEGTITIGMCRLVISISYMPLTTYDNVIQVSIMVCPNSDSLFHCD